MATPSPDETTDFALESTSAVKLRSYQEEMLEASLKRNVLVVMETGAGKTHVATFRILEELESGDPSKLVWFLTPKVALSEQQYSQLMLHLSGYAIRTLLGRDGVEHWSDQRLWDAVLKNVRVVVGTPAVLEQALSHGFVHMSRLALLVFDEAHWCTKKGPMNLIMANHYHPAKRTGAPVPHILGLSASPVIGSNPQDLASIEANLDAQAITPTRHRTELQQYVHPPEVFCVTFDDASSLNPSFPLYRALNEAVESYDMRSDPRVIELEARGDERSQQELLKLALQPKTYCLRELKALRQRSISLSCQLGHPVAEWYIRSCITKFLGTDTSDTLILPDLTENERKHLASILRQILRITSEPPHAGQPNDYGIDCDITEKCRHLIDALVQFASPVLRCVVFVEQRAVVHGLAHILRQQPDLASMFSIGTFVGASTHHARASIADMGVSKAQNEDLAAFRNGEKNLIIATNVLEEGIDVAACNLVISFDPPKNLVSFVQRRGRARQKDSKYIIFLGSNDFNANPAKWQGLEAEMRQAYMDEHRAATSAGAEEGDDVQELTYHVESTGAMLTIDNSKAHLYHFCNVSMDKAGANLDLRPVFDTTSHGETGPFTAVVQLPPIVRPDLRTASTSRMWQSETAAIKEAAFQAYIALHRAGMVNDNLLPLTHDHGPDNGQVHRNQPSIVKVPARLSPWKKILAASIVDGAEFYPAKFEVPFGGSETISVIAWSPGVLDHEVSFPLYWNTETTYMVNIQPIHDQIAPVRYNETKNLRDFTRTVLESLHRMRMPSDETDDFLVLYSVSNSLNDVTELAGGQEAASKLLSTAHNKQELGLIRFSGQPGRSFIYLDVMPSSVVDGSHVGPQIVVSSFPKRRDFLHPMVGGEAQNLAYATKHTLPLSDCTIDNLPARYSFLAAFLPSIFHRLEVAMLTQDLQRGILHDINIQDPALIYEAISSPSAREAKDYNRLEFLGDSILKFCAVRQVLAQHPHWPEGYLSEAKYRLVSNSFLTDAATRLGLGRYILTQPFTGSKWRPQYIHEILEVDGQEEREMSSKVLADVVEAMIGAAFVDGGLEKAFSCIQKVLPDESWLTQGDGVDALLDELAPCRHSDLGLLEDLVGHHFRHPTLLVEAITHISFPQHNSGFSYERLEFLGDAVLDLIIVPKLFAHPSGLKHWQLHRVHEALVCGDFLAFGCMAYGVEEERYNAAEKASEPGSYEAEQTFRTVYLHDFLRADSSTARLRKGSLDRFEGLHRKIDQALENDSKYPWPNLVALRPQKFFSDIVESVLGALYLDTYGNLAVCEAFVEKLGILKHMQRMLDQRIETAFPKEQVGILADKETVKYTVSRSEGETGAKSYECVLTVGEAVIAKASGCGSKDEAEVRAAWEGSKVLEARVNHGGSTNKKKLDIFKAVGCDEDN